MEYGYYTASFSFDHDVMSKQIKNMYELEKKKLVWHRHPLATVVVSFLLGGLALSLIQTHTNNAKMLREKRTAVMENIASFSANSASVFRAINSVALVTNNPDFPKFQYLKLQEKLQENIEETYTLANKTELELLVYFPETTAYNDFHKARLSFQDNVSKAFENIKLKKVSGKIFEDSDFDQQKILINKILIMLIDEIGFKGAEKHPIIINEQKNKNL